MKKLITAALSLLMKEPAEIGVFVGDMDFAHAHAASRCLERKIAAMRRHSPR